MKRRPHWDDDLIEAVIGATPPGTVTVTYDVYAVIAAVEDWQVQHARNKVMLVTGNPGTYVGDLEAAIQRVRDVPEMSDHWRGGDYEDGWNFCLETVINALDGGAE